MANEIMDNQGGGLARWRWPSVHPEGRKFAAIAALITFIFWFFDWDYLAWPMLAITIWVLAFFRDPERVTPKEDQAIIAPADGLITLIKHCNPPKELCGEGGLADEQVWRVSIFMSVFDVHINRSPIDGTVSRVVYIPGLFINADLDKASEDNERQHILIARSDGTKIGFTQIAGLVARRIVPFVKKGDFVAAGQRVGLIRFGSRVDVYLPVGTTPKILMGQRIVAGETVLGEIGEHKMIEGSIQ